MPAERGRRRPLFSYLALGLLGVGLATLAALAARRWLDVVEVRGESMAPTLLPGDRLLVERWTLSRRPPRVGELVLAADPRDRGRELVKRVASVRGGFVDLRGDAYAASTDSRTFGSLPASSVRWRVAARYYRRAASRAGSSIR